jgi:hypothetical protein
MTTPRYRIPSPLHALVAWYKRWTEKKAFECRLKQHGWRGKCPGCNEYVFPHDSELLEDLPLHWLLQCNRCKAISKWFLGFPIPVLDNGQYSHTNKPVSPDA